MWKGAADSKDTKRLSKNEIKKELLESIIINEVVESAELNKKAEEMAEVINISLKRRSISIAYYQGKVFKRFKEKEKFIKLASQLGIHKNTIIFKIVFKLCERYPKQLRSSIGLGLFKNYHKDIKTVNKENEEDLR